MTQIYFSYNFDIFIISINYIRCLDRYFFPSPLGECEGDIEEASRGKFEIKLVEKQSCKKLKNDYNF